MNVDESADNFLNYEFIISSIKCQRKEKNPGKMFPQFRDSVATNLNIFSQ